MKFCKRLNVLKIFDFLLNYDFLRNLCVFILNILGFFFFMIGIIKDLCIGLVIIIFNYM